MMLLSIPLTLAACRPAGEQVAASVVVDTVLAADGTAIVYDVRGDDDAALVFVHCWACDRSFWHGQLDAFAPAYRVVSLDLPGHGESGKSRAAWSIAGLAQDVRTVVDALDLQHVILIGHSMGGPVALLAAALLPGRVDGVVCVDAVHDVEMEFPRAMLDQMLAAFGADFAGTVGQMVSAMFPATADTAVVRWVTEKARAADTAAVLAIIRDYPNLYLPATLRGAGVPVRGVNAAPRPPIGPVTAIETNRKYADFDAVLMDSVGHYPFLERPDEFNAKLLAVIEGIRPATPR
jgi:pimeloyl-ACP methyl ester carboxylesterase